MSIEAIRSGFMAGGKGVVRLTHAGLACRTAPRFLPSRVARRPHEDGEATGSAAWKA